MVYFHSLSHRGKSSGRKTVLKRQCRLYRLTAVAASLQVETLGEGGTAPHPQESCLPYKGRALPSPTSPGPPSKTNNCQVCPLQACRWTCGPAQNKQETGTWSTAEGVGVAHRCKVLPGRPSSFLLLHNLLQSPRCHTRVATENSLVFSALGLLLCIHTRPKNQMQLWTVYHSIDLTER